MTVQPPTLCQQTSNPKYFMLDFKGQKIFYLQISKFQKQKVDETSCEIIDICHPPRTISADHHQNCLNHTKQRMVLLENWVRHVPSFTLKSNWKSTCTCVPVAPYALGHKDVGRYSSSTIQMRGTTVTLLFFRGSVWQQAWLVKAGIHVTNPVWGKCSWENLLGCHGQFSAIVPPTKFKSV